MGRRNLDVASRETSIPVTVSWEPFFLNRDTPPEGIDLIDYIASKYGPQMMQQYPARARQMAATGRKVGINFSDSRRVVNTLKAHSLMEWCNETNPNLSDLLMESLFQAYFEDSVDVNDIENLVACVSKVDGLDVSAAKTAIESGSYSEGVLRKDADAKKKRVNGVPFFIIENQNDGSTIKFSGAQPPDVIKEQLAEAFKA